MSPKKPRGFGVHADRGSAAIGGDVIASQVVVGSGNVLDQRVTLEGFREGLAELQAQARASALPAADAEAIEAELVDVERAIASPKANKALVVGKLGTVLGVLDQAKKAGEALVPLARQLGSWAGTLF